MEEVPNKIAAVQPVTTHFKNHPSKTNKTYGAQLRSKNNLKSVVFQLSANIRFSLENVVGAMDDRDGWRENQDNLN